MSVKEIIKSKKLSGFRATPEGHNGGEYVQKLETEFRRYFNTSDAIAFNSATSALHASLIALGIKPGDEVIVSPYSFSSSASCVLMVGAKPVFADIDPDTYCISPKAIVKAITSKTKAIIPVHLFGHPADMVQIMAIAEAHCLAVIEDAAQAITASYKGKYVGTFGHCGVFSFNQSKHINTGEGGMLITNEDFISRMVRAVRNHGEVADPELGVLGYNYRMCEIEASLALEQFKNIDRTIETRIRKARELDKEVSKQGFNPPVVKDGCKHVYYLYAIKGYRIPRGNSWNRGYVAPLYTLPIYRQFGYGKGLCPITEEVQSHIVVKSML